MVSKPGKIEKGLIGLTTILAFFVVANTEVQRNYLLEFTKTECYHYSPHVKSYECSLRNDSNGRLLDIRMELSSPINDFKMRTIVQLFRKRMPRMTIIDITLDGCEFLDTVHKQKVMAIALKTLKRYVNAAPKCPFQKDFNYTVTGLHLDAKDFPTYLPEGEFTVTNHFLHQNEFMMKASYQGRVVYLKKAK